MPHSSAFPPVDVVEETIHEKLLRAMKEHIYKEPNRLVAISANDDSERLSYRDLIERAQRFAAFLRAKDFRNGDVVTVVLANHVETFVVFLGTWISGGVLSGASASFTTYELESQIVDSRSAVIVTDADHLSTVLEAKSKHNFVKMVLCLRNSTDSSSLPDQVVDWKTVMETEASEEYENVSPRSPATLPYSSGTTGPPKGVKLSHVAVGTGAASFKKHYELAFGPVVADGRPFTWDEERLLIFIPLHHALCSVTLTMMLLAGGTIVLMKGFEPTLYCASIQKFRIRVLFAHPPLLSWLLKDTTSDGYDLSSVKIICSAGAPVGKSVCDGVRKKLPAVRVILQAYGLTEVTTTSHTSDLSLEDPFSGIGLPMPNFEHKVVDPETGYEVADGTVGELCIRTPTMMSGYLNRPQATADVIDADGWLNTGDTGFSDAQGRMTIVGRVKDLIKVRVSEASTHKVSPSEIEDVLLLHPSVREVAVVGIPDPELEGMQLIRAFVVRQDERDLFTGGVDELNKLILSKLSSYKKITGGVFFVDAIPRTPIGKIRRFKLKEADDVHIASAAAAS